MGTKIENLYSELAEYFVFDRRKYTLEELFGDIKLFKDQFKQVCGCHTSMQILKKGYDFA